MTILEQIQNQKIDILESAAFDIIELSKVCGYEKNVPNIVVYAFFLGVIYGKQEKRKK